MPAEPARLFLSYGHRDASELALRLRADLIAAGYVVWQDEQRIRAGHAWTEEIRDGLRESDLVVALLSPHSVRQKGWAANPDDADSVCLDEIEYAIDACRIPVLPLLAVSCEPPFRIYRQQFLDLRAWRERYDDLKQSVLDAVAACIATGRAPLRKWDRLPEPIDFTAFLAERRLRFTGRRWLFDTLRDRLAAPARQPVLVTGAPGIGKSAFIASLIHANPDGRILAYHCCQSTVPETLRPDVFVRSIAAMIAARNVSYAGMIESPEILAAFDEGKLAADPASAFQNLILNLLLKLPEPEAAPQLLVIDALDEALGHRTAPNIADLLSSRLAALPPWVRLVATTRDEPAVKRRFRTADLVPIDPAGNDNAGDLIAYVAARLEAEPLRARAGARRDEIAGKVLAHGRGNFLIVTTTLNALETVFDADDLDQLPPGLGPTYEEYFDRLYARAGLDFAPARQVLQAIVAAQEPPSREDLAALTGLDAEVDLPPMLGRIASLVPPRDGRYAPFHQTLVEWMTGWNADEDQPTAGPYFISRKAGHRLWADALLPRSAKGEWSAAVLRNLPTHLAGAERWNELAALLLDLRFLEAKTRGPETSVFALLSDFELALRVLPRDHPQQRMLFLVSEILRLDATFIAGSPGSLFQCLWNRGHWHDDPLLQSFFSAPPGALPPWKGEPKLSVLVDRWRAEKEKASPGFTWLRALRPPPELLGSAQRAIVREDEDGMSTVDISPDGTRVIAASGEGDGGVIGLWDAITGAPLARVEMPDGEDAQCVRFIPSGPQAGLAVAVTYDGRLLLLDESLQTVEAVASQRSFQVAAVSPDGTLIATGERKGELALWDAATLQLRHSWQAHDDAVTALAFSSSGRHLASTDQNFGGASRLRIWDVTLQPPRAVAEQESKGWFTSVCFAPGDDVLYWGNYDGVIERWAWPKDIRTRIRDVEDSPAAVVRLLSNESLLCGVGGAFEQVPIEIWNLAEGRVEQRLHGHLFGVSDIAVLPGTSRFASVGDATLRVWDLSVQSGSLTEPLERDVKDIAFQEGLVITSDEKSRTAWLRRIADGQLLLRLDQGVSCAVSATNPRGDAVITVLGDGTVNLWNIAAGDLRWQFALGQSPSPVAAFSGDGRFVAVAGYDCEVVVLDVTDGAVVTRTNAGGDDTVTTLALSHDGGLVQSGGLNSSVKLWKRETLERVPVRETAGVTGYHAWFAHDDQWLILEDVGEEPRAWDVRTGERVGDEAAVRAAYDALTFRDRSRWQWKAADDDDQNQIQLILLDGDDGQEVARYPEVRGGVQYHPGGRIWANQRSSQVSLLQLEGGEG